MYVTVCVLYIIFELYRVYTITISCVSQYSLFVSYTVCIMLCIPSECMLQYVLYIVFKELYVRYISTLLVSFTTPQYFIYTTIYLLLVLLIMYVPYLLFIYTVLLLSILPLYVTGITVLLYPLLVTVTVPVYGYCIICTIQYYTLLHDHGT
jgi:hypothetical protein